MSRNANICKYKYKYKYEQKHDVNVVIFPLQCLAPVPLCSGWKVTTVEGLGAKVSFGKPNQFCEISLLQPNYHPIQLELAANGGSQCGFCRFNIFSNISHSSISYMLFLSPGMVMQLHSFLQEHPDATMKQIDNILDGNLCRYIASSQSQKNQNPSQVLDLAPLP